MTKIISTYAINPRTLAILPAHQIDYNTIAIEQNQIKHVRQTPLQLIKAACFNDWTTYEGRRQAVIFHTNFKQKVPIPISIHKQMYLFPTHSPQSIYNNWIAFQHIAYIKEDPPTNETKKPQTIIHFHTGQTLKLNISKHTLQKQINRTFECMYRMEMMQQERVI